MANTARMREEFEAWAKLKWSWVVPELYGVAWDAWQAACRAQAKRDAEICQSERERAMSAQSGKLNDFSDTLLRHHALACDTCAEAIEQDAGI